MKNFFKPEDLNIPIYRDMTHAQVVQRYCDAANAKLEKLIESWPEVVGQIKNIDGGLTDKKYWCATQIPNNGETHKARLAFIEPLLREPCKHEPFTKGERAYKACTICGIELIATWSAK